MPRRSTKKVRTRKKNSRRTSKKPKRLYGGDGDSIGAAFHYADEEYKDPLDIMRKDKDYTVSEIGQQMSNIIEDIKKKLEPYPSAPESEQNVNDDDNLIDEDFPVSNGKAQFGGYYRKWLRKSLQKKKPFYKI